MLTQDMPPNPRKPRLKDLDSQEVVSESITRVTDRLEWISNTLSPAVEFGGVDYTKLLTTELAIELQRLIKWAKTGEGLPSEEFLDTVYTVWVAFYSNVANFPAMLSIGDESFQVGSPVGVVLAACFARFNLIQEKGVPSAQLAALASLSDARIRQLVADGVLVRTEQGLIDCQSAKDWLFSRGIKV